MTKFKNSLYYADMMDIVEYCRHVNYVLLDAVNSVKKDVQAYNNDMEEQDYLTAIVTKFPLMMTNMWGDVKYGGCFVHKSPQVSFTDGGRCEAGDLLVLCREKIDEEVRYNAALFQLKTTHNAQFIPTTDREKIQYRFYTEWPEFTIVGKPYSAEVRNIEPKTVSPGAQYMIINDPDDKVQEYWYVKRFFYHPCTFTHTIPESLMRSMAGLSFGRFLWDFIHWQNGRPIDPDKDKKDDAWSHFIWDMIKKTEQVMIRNINAGITQKDKIAKQQGEFFEFLTTREIITYIPQSYKDELAKERGRGDRRIQEDVNEEDNGAISILFIDINKMNTISI